MLEVAYLSAQLANNAFDGFCQEHLLYYRLADLDNIFQKFGLEVVNFGFNDVNGGSVWVVVRKIFGQSKAAWEMALEMENAIMGDNYLRQFRERLWQLTADIGSEISTSKKEIYCFGASTKGNVLLQQTGLNNYWIKGIVEVNKDKFGKFTPGTNIPIIDEKDAPDDAIYLVLPWHFRNSILERYKGSGRKFIFPLPYPEMVVA